jgi:hypothetical protein
LYFHQKEKKDDEKETDLGFVDGRANVYGVWNVFLSIIEMPWDS